MTPLSPPTPSDDEQRKRAMDKRLIRALSLSKPEALAAELVAMMHALLGEREAHSATRAALAALQHTARDVLDDYFGNVADGGESPERSYLRSLAAQCDVDFEQRMSEL